VAETIEVSDPRPMVSELQVLGSICENCGQTSAWRRPRCERCLGGTAPTRFGPGGIVWSSATVHLRVGHRPPPFTLAYVDLDGGPRVLARLQPDVELACGIRVQIVGTDEGDVVVSPFQDDEASL
jgi:uncharacterized protein